MQVCLVFSVDHKLITDLYT